MEEGTNGVARSLFGGLLLTILVFASLSLYSKAEDRQYQEEPIQTGVVEEKEINYTSSFLGSEKKNYHAIIDGKAYNLTREDWNKLEDGKEVSYKEGTGGNIRVTE